ncbi:sulfotransferase family protein [Streptomyces sp. 6N223]|uniref:sulfotransferase family protein n=1 Tax=Streptomyces sp. 6N223 TaxID=3457412 RepID=UPI003FCF02F8
MLDVFGAGLGRTGAHSLTAALERLGFGPCHTMLGMLEHPEQVPSWRRAAAGEAVNWREIYAGYRSSVNLPGSRFWREITAAFPEAKVILTVRDPDRWYESSARSIYPAATAPPQPGASEAFEALRAMSREVVWDGLFGGRFTDRDHALRVFREHNEAVAREIDPGRLLVLDVADGWRPLCDFLGVPVPDTPYPHQNDRARFASLIQEHTSGG